MLDKDVFKTKMDQLMVLYPNWKFDKTDTNVIRVWYEQFENMNDERFKHMVDEFIKNDRFNPTVKGLLENDTLPQKSATQLKHEKMLREYGIND